MANEKLIAPLAMGRHIVPGLWRYALPEEFQYFVVPDETKATCGNCPKIAEGYDPAVKCCTYNPRVANYFLGYALMDKASRPKILQVIEGQFATPEGLLHTTVQASQAYEAYSLNLFGQKGQPACRFIDKSTGFCGMYLYRNSTCSSFFCTAQYGRQSQEFWERFEAVAGQIEAALSIWCMGELGLDPQSYCDKYDAYGENLSATFEVGQECWSRDFLAEIWGSWLGREEEFYQKAADLIEQNKERLFAIACETKLIMPAKYEQAICDSLSESGQKEMRNHGALGGTPVSVEDLWYSLQLAQRNLAQVCHKPQAD